MYTYSIWLMYLSPLYCSFGFITFSVLFIFEAQIFIISFSESSVFNFSFHTLGLSYIFLYLLMFLLQIWIFLYIYSIYFYIYFYIFLICILNNIFLIIFVNNIFFNRLINLMDCLTCSVQSVHIERMLYMTLDYKCKNQTRNLEWCKKLKWTLWRYSDIK